MRVSIPHYREVGSSVQPLFNIHINKDVCVHTDVRMYTHIIHTYVKLAIIVRTCLKFFITNCNVHKRQVSDLGHHLALVGSVCVYLSVLMQFPWL